MGQFKEFFCFQEDVGIETDEEYNVTIPQIS